MRRKQFARLGDEHTTVKFDGNMIKAVLLEEEHSVVYERIESRPPAAHLAVRPQSRSKVEKLEAAVAGLKRRAAHDETLRKADHMRLLQARSFSREVFACRCGKCY
jgi:hypothetical protein